MTSEAREWTGIRISVPVKERLRELADARAQDLGRMVSYSEMIEQLINEWGNP